MCKRFGRLFYYKSILCLANRYGQCVASVFKVQQTHCKANKFSMMNETRLQMTVCAHTLSQLDIALSDGLVFVQKVHRKRLHCFETLPSNNAVQLLGERVEVANNGHL